MRSRSGEPTGAARARSFGLLALAGLALLAGLSGALVLVGLWAPPDAATLAVVHGILMPLGFLGTLIALERAVALDRPWGYASPLATGLGAIALAMGSPIAVGSALIAVGGGLFVAMYVAFDRIERSLHTSVQAAGAVGWLVAALLLVSGRPISAVVPWLAGFLILTVVGERLELSRLRRPSEAARRAFVIVSGIFGAGVIVTLVVPDEGVRIAGVGLVGLAAWLGRNDVARRTVKLPGVTRFVALSLLVGYVWLAIGGLYWLAGGAVTAGPIYDAALHALFLGFVISMVFGHAPVILPSVLRTPLPYRPRFYVHLALLHAGLVLRILAGDVLGDRPAWQLGGLLGVVALLVFAASSAVAVVEGRAGLSALRGRIG
ncbi:MAG TPA: hypothetical protein VF802_05765 [Candidatus Limnocylindrales bacterium]